MEKSKSNASQDNYGKMIQKLFNYFAFIIMQESFCEPYDPKR